MKLNLARILNWVGRTLIGAGVVILLFVAYQLWGTNVQESRAQDQLGNELSATFDQLDQLDQSQLDLFRVAAAPTSADPGAPPTSASPPASIPRELVDLLSPNEGEPLARVRIPTIKVEKIVVQGTAVEDLRRGPGHYSETPLPGQKGNAAIAGHRTTYGAPFNRIDELSVGDEIFVDTVQGTATYRVDKEPFVVYPNQVEVLNDYGDNRLTLTSCHPKLSARQRLVVTATLVGEPFPELPAAATARQVDVASTTTIADAVENPDDPDVTTTAAATTQGSTVSTTAGSSVTTTASPSTTDGPANAANVEEGGEGDALVPPDSEAEGSPDLSQGLAGDRRALGPALGWGAVTALVALAAWGFAVAWDRRAGGRRRGRHLLVYVVVSPAVLLLLYLCFENVDRLLPAY